MPIKAFRVSVPASSANLGPGFDAVGIALGLRLRADVRAAQRFELRFAEGADAPSHDGFERLIVEAMQRVDARLPRARIHIDNAIPLGKGLGSSAAASVLGSAIAMQAHTGAIDRAQLAKLACEIEGHPDNALAAVYGGAVVAASGQADAFVRIGAPRDLRALVVVPEIDFATAHARSLLPERYARRDVVFTAQRAALLGAALASGAWRELREAMCDRVHQPYRAPHIPGMEAALAVRARGMVGSALSGAGPSLIALLHGNAPPRALAAQYQACFERAGVASRTFSLAFAARGVALAGLDA